MTTKRKYYCNFCNVEIGEEIDGIAVKWVTYPNGELEHVFLLSDAENHICNVCLKAIKQVVDKRQRDDPCARNRLEDNA